MNIDWNEAPEGATHYGKDNDWYRKSVTGWDWYCRSEDSWHFVSFTEAFSTSRLTPRPVEWRGPQDGLPPVGLEVDCYRGGETWRRGKVVAHVEDKDYTRYAVVQREDGWSFQSAKYTRPIQTDRDKAIDEMVAVWKPTISRFAEENRSLAEMLYDAGYRKGEK